MKNSAEQGLPEHLFEYVSSITPLINIDLLVVNKRLGACLTWRKDKFYGPGWHIPGGIIRFKESVSKRIQYVAFNELGIKNQLDPVLISINQIKNSNRDIRGHFISLLFSATIEDLDLGINNKLSIENGSRRWHLTAPNDMISQQKIYIPIINNVLSKNKKMKTITNNLSECSF